MIEHRHQDTVTVELLTEMTTDGYQVGLIYCEDTLDRGGTEQDRMRVHSATHSSTSFKAFLLLELSI